jgi:hypothetical protein
LCVGYQNDYYAIKVRTIDTMPIITKAMPA